MIKQSPSIYSIVICTQCSKLGYTLVIKATDFCIKQYQSFMPVFIFWNTGMGCATGLVLALFDNEVIIICNQIRYPPSTLPFA